MAAPDWGYFGEAALARLLAAAHQGDDTSGTWRRGIGRAREDRAAEPFPDDAVLFGRLRSGDREALDALYRATYADLWQFAYTYVRAPDLAEEIVQEVFVALMVRERELPVSGTIRGYLFASVRNRALNALRSTRRVVDARERAALDDTVVGHGAPPPAADAALASDDLRELVARAVRTLPERQQRAVLLRYAAQLPFGEVAAALGVSPDAARMLVNRATRELRRQLAGLVADATD